MTREFSLLCQALGTLKVLEGMQSKESTVNFKIIRDIETFIGEGDDSEELLNRALDLLEGVVDLPNYRDWEVDNLRERIIEFLMKEIQL